VSIISNTQTPGSAYLRTVFAQVAYPMLSGASKISQGSSHKCFIVFHSRCVLNPILRRTDSIVCCVSSCQLLWMQHTSIMNMEQHLCNTARRNDRFCRSRLSIVTDIRSSSMTWRSSWSFPRHHEFPISEVLWSPPIAYVRAKHHLVPMVINF
jgi:hypothetical protein